MALIPVRENFWQKKALIATRQTRPTPMARPRIVEEGLYLNVQIY